MGIKTKLYGISFLLSRPYLFTMKQGALFTFSHMRSRSSVLSHILGSHPEIFGHGELHKSYKHSWSLLKLRAAIRQKTKEKFFYDKLLHNQHEVAEIYLENHHNKFIFLIRNPKDSYESYIRMEQIIKRTEKIDSIKMANFFLKYYIQRLQSLEKLATHANKNAIYINSDFLVKSPDSCLSQLTEFLNLSPSLDKNYNIFPETGNLGHGDPSAQLKKGKLEETKYEVSYEADDALLDKANQTYHDVTSRLEDKLRSIA